MANPWDNDPVVGSAAPSALGGRPIIRKGVDPVKPDLPQGYGMQGDTAAPVPGLPSAITTPETYRPITPQERTGFGLDPKKPFVVNVKTGKPELIREGKDDAAATTDPALAKSIKGLGIDEWLTNVDRARQQIHTGFATGVLGSIAGHFPGTPRKDFLGALQGIKGASILEKLQALREQSKTGASGMGSLTEQEGERLANSIASLSDDMSAAELKKSLTIIERHAKSLQAIGDGLNPEDPGVQEKYKIPPLPGAVEQTPPPAALPPENPLANNSPGDQGPQLTVSGGGTKSVIDPKKQALGQRIVGLVSKGADRNTIMGFAVGADPTLRSDPEFRGWVDKALQYRKQHPKAQFSIDPGFYTTEVPLEGDEVGSSGFDSAVRGFADAGTAGNLANIAGLVGADKERAKQSLAASAEANPGASLAGNVAGGVTAGLGLEGILAKLGMAPGILRGAVADTTYGGAAGAGSDSDMSTAGRIANGALYGLGGSVAGQGLLRIPGAAFRGATSPATSYVAREVPGAMTIGQAVGGKLKGVEDRLSGLGLGVAERRLEGLQKMNAKAFDRALEPIGAKADGKFGEEAVAHAQDQVGGAFKKALSGKAAGLDMGFIKDAERAKMGIEKLPDRVRQEVDDSINEVVNNYFDDSGQISGENMQALLRELGQIKRGYQGDPLGHRIGSVVDQFSDSVENLFRRQAPDVMPQYDAAKKAFRRVSTLEDAVLRAKNESADGNAIFTPGQLGLADRANTVKFGGKHAAAAGKGEFHEFQRNTQEVLANKVPDTGSAGRVLIPATIAGGVLGGGGGAASGNAPEGAAGGAGTGLTLAALLSLAYSKAGQRALTASVLKRPNAAKTVGRALQRVAPVAGHGLAAQAALGGSRE